MRIAKAAVGPINKTVETVKQFCSSWSRREGSVRSRSRTKILRPSYRVGVHTSEAALCLERTGRGRRDDRLPREGADRNRSWHPRKGEAGGTATGLGELGAQESLNGRIDVPACGNQGLQVSLPVDEAHGVELI